MTMAARAIATGDTAAPAPIIAPGFFDAGMAATLFDVLHIRAWRNEGRRDAQVSGAVSFWGDALLDALLFSSLSAVERRWGARLLPTYAYARLYRHGDALPRHRDRVEAEVAVTVHLGQTGSVAPPPICFAPDLAVRQAPGDAVVYAGDAVAHWRDAFTGDTFGQLFLNYVAADGPRAALIFDGRRGVFPPHLVDRLPIR